MSRSAAFTSEPPVFERIVVAEREVEYLRMEFDTRWNEAPDEYQFDCIHLRGLKGMRVHLRHERFDPGEDTIDLFPRDLESLNDGAQLFVHILRQDSGKWLSIYPRGKFLLPGKREFDGALLALADVPPFYQHEFFTSKERSRRRLVHVYRSEQRTVYIGYSLNSAAFETCDPFLRFARKTVLRK